MVVDEDQRAGGLVQGHADDLPDVDGRGIAPARSDPGLAHKILMVIEKEDPALLMLQALELRQHQLVDTARREHRALDDGRFFLQETAAQLEGRQHAGHLARSDAGQGQHPLRRKVEQHAQPAVGEVEKMPRQVEGAGLTVAAAQQDGEQFAVTQAPRTAGEHLFARPLVRAEFLDRHNGRKDTAKNRIKRK